ncbi:predicted protein [Nematostella vectensis]|uniref:Potassium channel domain-containing protein n=1 Tax=Nematostella vectensis TaxID=45351 RepID=A7S8A6_NEMVE|nr:predicted protein [Nematostella vectensis]|eukprot:XP_001632093.1 predicted protein [Nematostella vectensis]
MAGIFHDILTESLKICCPAIKLEFKKIATGNQGLRNMMDGGDFDVIAPVGNSPYSSNIRGYPFLEISESSGSAILMSGNASGGRLLFSVLSAWPILIFIVISATLAGVIIWFLERKENPKQFPEAFSTGVFEGFWWAFVTMTTVGYGDKAPKTLFGKLVGSLWILMGLIITTMFISIITSALAESTAADGQANVRGVEVMRMANVRGVEVSVVNQSEEHKLAIRQNAKITALQNQEQVLGHLKDRKVMAALADIQSLKHQNDDLTKNFVLVASVIPNHISYGLVLARNSSKLQKCLGNFMEMNENWRYRLLQENAGSKKVEISPADDYFGSGGIFSVSVYAGLGLFAMLFAGGMAWEFYKHRKRAKTKCSNEQVQKGAASTANETKGHAISSSQNHTAGIVIHVPQPPPARLKLGHTPQEELLSRQSMEIMEMENQFNRFKTDWERRKSALERRQGKEEVGVANGGFDNSNGRK